MAKIHAGFIAISGLALAVCCLMYAAAPAPEPVVLSIPGHFHGDPEESIPAMINRGGWQEWAGRSGFEKFPEWKGYKPDDPKPVVDWPRPANRVQPPEEREGDGAVDITDVGEGTERVRLGLEGPWQGISSSSLPGRWQDHEGGGYREHPVTSSVAIKPVPDRWVRDEDDEEGDGFPGDLLNGNFPGVAPNDPDGTSWMIGMHRDGEDTMGKWARQRQNGLRQQQLFMVGSDVTDIGEENRDSYVPGVYGALPSGTSWVVGMHREPQWSDSQTYACGTTTPCAKGQADQGHYFQSDTNPFVDRRRVFDSYAQLEKGNPKGKKAFPWDPTRDPQIWKTGDCSDGDLRPECYRNPMHSTKKSAAAKQKGLLVGLGSGKQMQRLHNMHRGVQAGKTVKPKLGRWRDDDWQQWVDKALAPRH